VLFCQMKFSIRRLYGVTPVEALSYPRDGSRYHGGSKAAGCETVDRPSNGATAQPRGRGRTVTELLGRDVMK
jgi:hypothetical protein